MANQSANAKCRVCRMPSTLTVGLHRVCSYACGVTLAQRLSEKRKAKEAKESKRKHADDKRRTKRKSDLMREAQAAFNAWIRERDKHLPCVSCGRPSDGMHQRHAGHYMTTAAHSELRFDENNVHAQCSVCNNHLSGNLLGYRAELIQRIGIAEVERLETSNATASYSRELLENIKRLYSAKVRESRRGM